MCSDQGHGHLWKYAIFTTYRLKTVLLLKYFIDVWQSSFQVILLYMSVLGFFVVSLFYKQAILWGLVKYLMEK